MKRKLVSLIICSAVFFINPFVGQNVMAASVVTQEKAVEMSVDTSAECVDDDVDILNATEYTYGDWIYTLSTSDEATIKKYVGTEKIVDIPDKIGEYDVVKIGIRAFKDSKITKVIIPEGITYIDSYAFSNCYYLEEIEFNAQKCSMGSGRFSNAGSKAEGISVVFGDTVEEIPSNLFYGDSDSYPHVTSVKIGKNVKHIGSYAFARCFDLKDVTIGNAVEVIGSYSFSETGITKLLIPENVTKIWDKAFAYCQYLQEIQFNAKDCSLYSGTFYDAGIKANYLVVTFGPLVNTIPEGLFNSYEKGNYAAVTGVEISANVKTIEASAFYQCLDLNEIVIPPNVTKIYKSAFTKAGLSNGTVYCVKGSTADDAELYPDGTKIQYIPAQFHDVDPTTWQYAPAKYVYDKGVMTGKGTAPDGTTIFQPNAKLTRAEFAQMLYSSEGKPGVQYTNRFSDLPEGKWYTNAVLWAAENGIVSGYTNGKYGVDDPITREQLAAMLYKYAQYKGYDMSAGSELSGFTDRNMVSGWAKTQIQWAVNHGVMSGKGMKLDPIGNATRAECAAMIRTFMVTFEE